MCENVARHGPHEQADDVKEMTGLALARQPDALQGADCAQRQKAENSLHGAIVLYSLHAGVRH